MTRALLGFGGYSEAYVSEKDSDAWQAIALAEDRPLRSSELLLAEMAFALRQKECRAEIETGAARHLYRLFRDDVSDGRIEVFSVGMDVLEESAVLAVSEKPKNMPLLRTLDGLHLATARLLKCRTIATADSRMQDVAGAGICSSSCREMRRSRCCGP